MGSIRTDNAPHILNTTLVPLSQAESTNALHGPSNASAPEHKPVVNLFDQSSYQATPAVTLTDGTTITLPTSSAEDAQVFQTLFANIPDEHKAALNTASANIASAVLNYLQQASPSAAQDSTPDAARPLSVADAVQTSSSADTSKVGGANAVAKNAVGGVSKVGGSSLDEPSTQPSAPIAGGNPPTTYTISQASPDVAGMQQAITSAASAYNAATGGEGYGTGGYDATVQAVAYMGVQGLQQGLGTYAQQMQGQINNQNTVRTDQNEIASAVADWPSGTETQTFTFHDIDANGNLQTYTKTMTQAQAKTEAGNLSNTLASMSDDTQMMQTRLQTMEQNYQQGVTTISNLMKMQYDMVKNTIGNIHY